MGHLNSIFIISHIAGRGCNHFMFMRKIKDLIPNKAAEAEILWQQNIKHKEVQFVQRKLGIYLEK